MTDNPHFIEVGYVLFMSLYTSVIRKKSNILYFNFDYKFDLQIQIVAIFRKKVF